VRGKKERIFNSVKKNPNVEPLRFISLRLCDCLLRLNNALACGIENAAYAARIRRGPQSLDPYLYSFIAVTEKTRSLD